MESSCDGNPIPILHSELHRDQSPLRAQVHRAEPETRSKVLFPFPLRIDGAAEIWFGLLGRMINLINLFNGQCMCIFRYFDQHCLFLKVHSVRDEELKKECHWKNNFHINVTSPKDLSCDSIIDLDQMHGTSCSALCSMLACSYGFLCGQIFFINKITDSTPSRGDFQLFTCKNCIDMQYSCICFCPIE